MDSPWIQKHDAEVTALQKSKTSVVVGVGTGYDVTPGLAEPKNANLLFV
jgi:hypothetical protein